MPETPRTPARVALPAAAAAAAVALHVLEGRVRAGTWGALGEELDSGLRVLASYAASALVVGAAALVVVALLCRTGRPRDVLRAAGLGRPRGAHLWLGLLAAAPVPLCWLGLLEQRLDLDDLHGTLPLLALTLAGALTSELVWRGLLAGALRRAGHSRAATILGVLAVLGGTVLARALLANQAPGWELLLDLAVAAMLTWVFLATGSVVVSALFSVGFAPPLLMLYPPLLAVLPIALAGLAWTGRRRPPGGVEGELAGGAA